MWGRAFLALLLLAWASCASANQARTYASVWSGLFDSATHRHLPDASTIVQGWRDGAAELQAAQARVLQRLTGNASAAANVTSLHSALRSLFGDSSLLGGEHHSSLEELLSRHLIQSALLLGTQRSAGGSGDGQEVRGWAARLQQHLQTDWSKADPHQLAAIAALQGWALSSLLASRAAQGSRAGQAAGDGGAANSSASTSAASGGAGGALPSALSLEQVLLIPNPVWSAFSGQLCTRMQNFGNADGFRAAMLGPGQCPSGASAATEAAGWGGRAAFTLDCSAPVSSLAAQAQPEAASTAADAGSRQGEQQAAWSWGATAVGLRRAAACQLAIVSDSGRGVLLAYAVERPLLGPQLNALRVRVCNIAPSTLQRPAAPGPGGTRIVLRAVRLNGRQLLPAAGLAADAAADTAGCVQQLVHVPGRAVARGFVLTGQLLLEDGAAGGGSGAAGGWGVGEQSSVSLELGEYKLLDAASTKLLGALAGAGQAPA